MRSIPKPDRNPVSTLVFWFAALFLLAGGPFSAGCGHHAHDHKHHHAPEAPRQPVVDGQVMYQSPGRDDWQKPDQVIAALNLREGMTVADLGSGTGYFTFRLAAGVGASGKVYAVDVEPQMNAYVDQQAGKRGTGNVTTVLAEFMDPKLPQAVDLIFSVNAYHHLEDRAHYFKNAAKYLKAGGQLVIIDFREGAFRHFTRKQTLLDDLKAAGYNLVADHDFLPRQNFLVFAPAQRAAGPNIAKPGEPALGR